MVQFKPYFLELSKAPHSRLTSCQKCFRTSDIESVGDTSHLTFFEMLGNFSVGDYFKREAVQWAWEFVTSPSYLGLLPERLWATVYLDDDEAMELWKRVGVPEGRIRRFGKGDNWWGPAGNEGPCGPCSELHYDFGPEHGCGREECAPNCECGRFLEIWNLVFMQFNQGLQGDLTSLPRPNIDTGMGLERVAAVMQGKNGVYETDLFVSLIDRVGRLCGKGYGESPDIDRAIRVVAEHGRSLAFLIADGVVPGNDGRGYVLRRLLRRAALFGRRLGLEDPFLGKVAQAVMEHMGVIYPELARHRDLVLSVVGQEEERFSATLQKGLDMLEGYLQFLEQVPGQDLRKLVTLLREGRTPERDELTGLEQWSLHGSDRQRPPQVDRAKGFLDASEEFILKLGHVVTTAGLEDRPAGAPTPLTIDAAALEGRLQALLDAASKIVGREVFTLYDTYGFPPELTAEVARERGFEVDLAEFETEMEKQREQSRASHRFGGGTDGGYALLEVTTSLFMGYHTLTHRSGVTGLLIDGEPVSVATEGQEVEVVLAETPFYGEQGGQLGDTGTIRGFRPEAQSEGPRGTVVVEDTLHPLPDLTIHRGKVVEGELALGDPVDATVDEGRRLDIARNHTATHLLQTALRRVVGEHVYQRGSLVAPDRLRFDYSHYVSLSPRELSEVQAIVNEGIRWNLPVSVSKVSYREAMDQGVIALFGEKYGEVVRMVQAGDFSQELCGGTHLRATGEIGFFVILSEASIGSGLRRLEAVTGRGAEAFVRERLSTLDAIADVVKSADSMGIAAKIEEMVAELERERRRSWSLEMRLIKDESRQLINRAEEVGGVKVVSARVQVSGRDALREMGDMVRDGLGSGVVVLGALVDQRPAFLAMVTKDLLFRGLHAGEMVKAVSGVTGGGGGGRPEMAQAGGKDGSKLDQALGMVKEIMGRLKEQGQP
jgi:alanyl-tRNA synthetase